MSKKAQLDMDQLASALGATRKGTVNARSGYFGAAQLAADVQARFQTPRGGGRQTDPQWTERRLLPLTAATLQHLQRLSETLEEKGIKVTPLQVAALLLERAVTDTDDGELAKIVQQKAS